MQKKIIIIEDESDIRQDLVKALQYSGYETYSAIDGRAGYDLALQVQPDLIISDIMMPKLNGHQVLKKLQDNKSTSHIPFLFLSAKSDKEHIREGMTLGADDFITKPYDLDELLNAVAVRLKKSESIETKYTEKVNNLRSSFSKSIPHEIRTPLNIILGLSDYMSKKYDTIPRDDVIEMISNINDSGKRLQRLFENYLFYSKLEIISINDEEIQKLKRDELSFIDLIINDAISYKAEQYKRSSDIRLEIIDRKIKIAEKYFIKIVEELIDNSLKFSEPGTEITIKSFVNDNHYILEFNDKGRGMSRQQIQDIGAYVQFDRKFYEQQGNGLGLAIVRKLVHLHDGTFKILSEQGKYTKVILTLLMSEDQTSE